MTQIKIHQQYGFTLFELTITFTILAIVTTLALPKFDHLQARSESKNIYPYLKTIIQQHKENAVLKRQIIILCPSNDSKTCSDSTIWNHGILAVHDRNNNKKYDATDSMITFHPNKINHGTLTWKGGITSPKTIILQSDTGLPRGSIGSFTYCSHKYSADLSHKSSLGLMGHLRYEKLNAC